MAEDTPSAQPEGSPNPSDKGGSMPGGPKKAFFTKQNIVENVKSFGIAIFLVLIIRSSIVEAFKIPSGSMIPTLLVGDHIFVNKFAYGLKVPFSDFFTDTPLFIVKRDGPQRGDIIVFKYPKDESFYYIKRVIGIPKDVIRVRDKVVYVNDKPLERVPANRPDVIAGLESRQYDKSTLELFDEPNATTGEKHLVMLDKANYINENYGPITVPDDHLFVMGDNRDFSNDSRFWGFVPFKNVRGKAMVVWLSLWIDIGESQYYFHPTRIGTVIH